MVEEIKSAFEGIKSEVNGAIESAKAEAQRSQVATREALDAVETLTERNH